MDPYSLSVLAGAHALRCIRLSPSAQSPGLIADPQSCEGILNNRKKTLTAPLRACVRPALVPMGLWACLVLLVCIAAPVSGTERAQAPTDFRRISSVAVGTKDRVGPDARTLLSMMRVDVFPDDLTCRRDLEHATPLAFTDQRVARGETLYAADVRAE